MKSMLGQVYRLLVLDGVDGELSKLIGIIDDRGTRL